MAELQCPNVQFLSPEDEASFFQWAHRIPSVVAVNGRANEIILVLRSKSISNESLRELIALFQRYAIPMSQLSAFKTQRNSSWFCNPEAYWYECVFNGIN